MRLTPPRAQGKFPLVGQQVMAPVDLSRQRSSGEPLRMSCHFPLLSPFIPLKPTPQHSRVHLLVGLESGWPWDSNAWIGEYSLFYLGTASVPTSAQIRDVLKQGFSLRAPRMPWVTKLSEPEVASAFGCRPEAIMFCQLISADSPPRLISNIGYFENDRIFPFHLSFNSMRAAPHPCLLLPFRSCNSHRE